MTEDEVTQPSVFDWDIEPLISDTCSLHSALQRSVCVDVETGDIFEKALKVADLLERTSNSLKNQVNGYKRAESRRQRPERKRIIPPRFTENILIITVIWQVLGIAILELLDVYALKVEKEENTFYIVGIVIMMIFQFTNLIISLFLTVKLTKQYMHHTATMKFLLQSYLSSLFVFAGIYTFIARVMPNFFTELRGIRKEKYYALELYSQLLFTSISTGTLCGAASVVAVHWFPELLMSFQMMLSFVYFASILSQVINPSLESSKKGKKGIKDSSHVLTISQKTGKRSKSRSQF